jgi:hypothetical protein
MGQTLNGTISILNKKFSVYEVKAYNNKSF